VSAIRIATISAITTSCGTISVMAVLADMPEARRKGCAPPAGKSTLSRLEQAPEEGVTFAPARYHKIGHDLFVTLFLEAHWRPTKGIIVDLEATDNPVHGHQEGPFIQAYHD
jgi:hypothetical protein